MPVTKAANRQKKKRIYRTIKAPNVKSTVNFQKIVNSIRLIAEEREANGA